MIPGVSVTAEIRGKLIIPENDVCLRVRHAARLPCMDPRKARSNHRPIGRGGVTGLRNLTRFVAGAAILGALLAAAGCAGDQQVETLQPGVLTVAVTSGAPTDQYDPQRWIRRYVEQFAAEHELMISWVVVPFNDSWLLASRDAVDLVATNVASFPDRAHSGATFSSPFLFERRALRIHPKDEGRYNHINDFIDRTVGVVSGMAAERDVNRRAPDGVIVRRAETFTQLYEEFDAGQLDAIAEAEYYALDDRVIPSHGNDVILIDHHDLTPGQREESVFVVRDKSLNLHTAINAFIARTRFPPQARRYGVCRAMV